MFASRHTFLTHTGHTPQGPSCKDALQTPGLILLLLHALGAGLGEGRAHVCFMTVSHQSVHADQSHSDGHTRAQGASAASPPPG